MTLAAAAPYLGATATVLLVFYAWPQTVRAMRAKDLHGISPLTTLMIGLNGFTWFIYGMLIGDPFIRVANASTFIASGITAYVLLKHHLMTKKLVFKTYGFWLLAMIITCALFNEKGAGYVAIFLSTAMTIPQAAKVIHSGDGAGVSLTTYVMLAIVNLAWLAYGIAIADWIVALPNLLSSPIIWVLIARLLRKRPAAPSEIPDPIAGT